MRETTPKADLLRGVWKENPVLVQLLGLCPTLAVTNTVVNALAMAGATAFVLVGSSLLVSTLKKSAAYVAGSLKETVSQVVNDEGMKEEGMENDTEAGKEDQESSEEDDDEPPNKVMD